MGPCGLVPLPGTGEENKRVRKRDKKTEIESKEEGEERREDGGRRDCCEGVKEI